MKRLAQIYLDLTVSAKLAIYVACFSISLMVVGGFTVYALYSASPVVSVFESQDHTGLLSKIVGGAIAVITALGLFFGWVVKRSIVLPLQRVIAAVDAVGDGDLTVQVEVMAKDDLGRLTVGVNKMISQTRAVIQNLLHASTQSASAAIKLHVTSSQIATGTEEIAAQAGTVATAGEEMSATANDIAQNCHHAAVSAKMASSSAQQGAAIVQQTLENLGQIADTVCGSAMAIQQLSESTEQVGGIVSTIEEIADQTNLLALNAAIEAARAGDQGRGFAVVADEVRKLADRTTQATKEIGRMIKTIQKETHEAVKSMEQGVKEVEIGAEGAMSSGEALEKILAQVDEVMGLVNQIATAAEEQTATTGEISSNMLKITNVVQITAHSAAETATAAAELSGNAEELQQIVSKFRI